MAQVQEVLAGRYELLDMLGRGGMGVVYRAKDRRLDRVVAVKVLPLDSAQDPTSVARFEREALAAAALTHRNIVAVFDSGRDDGTRFIVMERVGGSSFAQLIRQRGTLEVDEAVGLCAQVASALAAAHQAGIVHRDIKPANLMLDEHGTVKVLDFGIVRLAGSASLTQAATVLGSASYLAPELSRGARADARSDIYALGCVLYELLTGHPPFTGEQPAAILSQHITSRPRPPELLNPAIPPALAQLMIAMLAKDPDERPQRAGELATALPATLSSPFAAEAIGETAPTLLFASADELPTEPTMVMRRSPAIAWFGRRAGIAAAATVAALAIALLELTGGSGAGQAPARAATHPKTATVESHKRSTVTTTTPSVVTPVSTAPPAQPPAKQHGPKPHPGHGPGDGPGPGGPPGHHGGGPHGLPPGQAKKLADQSQNQQ